MQSNKNLAAAFRRRGYQSLTYSALAVAMGCGGQSDLAKWHRDESSVGGSQASGGSTSLGTNKPVTTVLSMGGSTTSRGMGSAAGTPSIGDSRAYGGNVAVAGGGSGTSNSRGGSESQQTVTGFPFCSGRQEATSPGLDESDLAAPPISAGFVEIPKVSYRALDEAGHFAEHVSGAAKLFYSFVPADRDPKRAPLFLIFNGGPGGATMNALRSHGTTPMVINTSTGAVETNPHSWSQFGNLLYVDARQAGFSYSELEVAQLDAGEAAFSECPRESFNRLVDAADFARVLLAVYAKFPVLEDNPVVIAGESWGGIRAQYLLNLLRNPTELATGGDGLYIDLELAASLQQHRARVDARRELVGLAKSSPHEQFAWQVLIQPALSSALPFGYNQLRGCQPCVGALEARAAELGVELPAPVMHQINLSRDEALARDAHTRETLLSPSGFEQLLGVAAASIGAMGSGARRGATRFGLVEQADWECSAPSAEWSAQLGALAPGDCYFMSLSPCGCPDNALSVDLGIHGGKLFLKNLRGVHTFITRALLDGVIVADAIPAILQAYAPDSNGNTLVRPTDLEAVQSAIATHAPVAGVARPGHIDVTYVRAPADQSSTVRRIRFPTYENAGHEVAASSPRELSEDILEFLCAPETP